MIKDKIQHLLFDFGGVLYQIDQTKTLTLFKQYFDNSIKLSSLNLNDFLAMSFFRDYETGKIDSHQFRNEVRQFFNIQISDSEFDEIWNATLIAPFDDIYDILKRLKPHYKINLLSNTNEIHFNHFYPECKECFSLFDNKFYSYKIGYMKPSPQAFLFVLEQLKTEPENVLFIDDLERNIAGAKQIGLQTFHFDYNKNRKILLDFLLSE